MKKLVSIITLTSGLLVAQNAVAGLSLWNKAKCQASCTAKKCANVSYGNECEKNCKDKNGAPYRINNCLAARNATMKKLGMSPTANPAPTTAITADSIPGPRRKTQTAGANDAQPIRPERTSSLPSAQENGAPSVNPATEPMAAPNRKGSNKPLPALPSQGNMAPLNTDSNDIAPPIPPRSPTPPPPPPPPSSSSSSSSSSTSTSTSTKEVSDNQPNRVGLLSDIAAGKTLKKVTPDEKPKAPNLLDDITKGKTLKKVDPSQVNTYKPVDKSATTVLSNSDLLNRTLASKRASIEDDDDDKGPTKPTEWDD